MGRESTVTFEQIAAVADGMKLENIKPTSRAVRERLGNTGSMGTINKLLGRWKAGQERQVSAALALPPALQRVLLEFMDNELTSARTTLEAELADQQQEAADLATENERQVVENDAQAEAIEALRAEVAEHKGRAGQLEADLSTARDEAARERGGAELARTELAKAQLRLEAMPRLEADLVAARASLDAERAARVAAEQSAAVLSARLESAERRATEEEGRTTKAEAATAQATVKAEALARDLTKVSEAAREEAAEHVARLEAETRRATEAEARTAKREAKVETLAGDLAKAMESARLAREESAELRGRLAAQTPAVPAAEGKKNKAASVK